MMGAFSSLLLRLAYFRQSPRAAFALAAFCVLLEMAGGVYLILVNRTWLRRILVMSIVGLLLLQTARMWRQASLASSGLQWPVKENKVLRLLDR